MRSLNSSDQLNRVDELIHWLDISTLSKKYRVDDIVWTSNQNQRQTQSLPWIQDRPIMSSSAKSQSVSEKCPNPGVEEVQAPNAAPVQIKSSAYESVEGQGGER